MKDSYKGLLQSNSTSSYERRSLADTRTTDERGT